MTKPQNYLKYSNYKIGSQFKRLNLAVALAETLRKKLGRSLRVLDVGCGIGNMSIPIASLGHEVLGIDLDEPTIAKARELNQFRNARFEVSTMDDVPIGESYDLIICAEIIEHLHDANTFLASVVSHLTDSGSLIISIPNGYGSFEIIEFIRNCFGRIFHGSWFGHKAKRIFYRYLIPQQEKIVVRRDSESPHVAHYTLRQFKKFISEHGLRITFMRNTNFISGFYPLYTITSKMIPIKIAFDNWDCNLSDRLPHWMASGWYFELTKADK